MDSVFISGKSDNEEEGVRMGGDVSLRSIIVGCSVDGRIWSDGGDVRLISEIRFRYPVPTQ